MKIDEYVPAMIPTMSVRAKSFVVSPPMRNKARSARKMVSDVLIERPNVSETDLPTVSANVSLVLVD